MMILQTVQESSRRQQTHKYTHPVPDIHSIDADTTEDNPPASLCNQTSIEVVASLHSIM